MESLNNLKLILENNKYLNFLKKFDFVDIISSFGLLTFLIFNYKNFLLYNRIYNLFGILIILFIAYLFSSNRSKINTRLIRVGLFLHLLIASFILKTNLGKEIVESAANGIKNLYLASDAGIEFLFGKLGVIQAPWGFIFAFKVLPIIIFFGAFMSLLFYFGIIQKFIAAINFFVRPILGTSATETLCAISNSFLGQTEAPLLIRQYLPHMTKSEYMVIMVSGMGTISGSILAVFASTGVPAVHLLASSVMAIPATILIAKILYPETEKTESNETVKISYKSNSVNFLDAISVGTTDGLYLALNVGAMLIAFLSLIAVVNSVLGFCCWKLNFLLDLCHLNFHISSLTLQDIFGFIFTPFAWILGFIGHEAYQVAQLLGTKLSINELVAYTNMIAMNLPERTVAIMTYALCGFANFSCIGIQIGGIGALVPEKRHWLSELGFRALLGATLSNLLSALVAAILL
ncbi:NupC/NupG family nucleoside CNT transporter [Candidatus Dependentiae bacterium]|nr:NupC/NupG family nucleoside CNT transporter [Candidatus Dependentiae bacterium]